MAEIGKLNKGEIAVFILPNGNPCYTISNGWQFRTVDKAVEKELEVHPGIEPKFIAFLNSGVEIDPSGLPVAKMGRKPDPNRPKKEEKTKAEPAKAATPAETPKEESVKVEEDTPEVQSETVQEDVTSSEEEVESGVIITEEVNS